jgi:hypothetical protein
VQISSKDYKIGGLHPLYSVGHSINLKILST